MQTYSLLQICREPDVLCKKNTQKTHNPSWKSLHLLQCFCHPPWPVFFFYLFQYFFIFHIFSSYHLLSSLCHGVNIMLWNETFELVIVHILCNIPANYASSFLFSIFSSLINVFFHLNGTGCIILEKARLLFITVLVLHQNTLYYFNRGVCTFGPLQVVFFGNKSWQVNPVRASIHTTLPHDKVYLGNLLNPYVWPVLYTNDLPEVALYVIVNGPHFFLKNVSAWELLQRNF